MLQDLKATAESSANITGPRGIARLPAKEGCVIPLNVAE
jgi:hypothetical protein